ncbi:hypothetical protein, partial [Ralstonia pseudosolanacearum]|uniref:hypothetical protein n=1 Tax=Ralstonia pseudosolanacearum TaxID=1310165 RepID=UPI003221C454
RPAGRLERIGALGFAGTGRVGDRQGRRAGWRGNNRAHCVFVLPLVVVGIPAQGLAGCGLATRCRWMFESLQRQHLPFF